MTQAATLETLLFKATNPSNKLEDVNTIKQFCDLVNKTNANGSNEGSVTACKILAHKIQSPQVLFCLNFITIRVISIQVNHI